jgi:deazaflavin-dependent oxidoreductase (nitroreductase family)
MPDSFHHPPGWFTRHVVNPIVAGLTRLGLPLAGSRVLEVRGRKSGEWRQTPVNPLEIDGATFLVAPRGTTQWVRNMRVSGEGRLRSRSSSKHFTAVEVPDAEKPQLLRAYLERWKWETGVFFGGIGADSSDEELLRIAPDHPIFRIEIDAASI